MNNAPPNPLHAAAAMLAFGAGLTHAADATRAYSHAMIPLVKRGRRDTLRHHAIRNSKRTPTPEAMYRDLIAAGMVRIERRRGKAPKIIWL